MPITPEQRAANLAKAREAKAAKKTEEQAKSAPMFAEIVSTADTSEPDLHKMLAEIADLKQKLEISEAARTEAEKFALAQAEAQGLVMYENSPPIPTGKTIGVKRCERYKVVGHKDDGRDILRPVFKEVLLPTYFKKINMPPVGGFDMKLNGQSFYHGTVYEFDIDTLRTVMDMEFRLWQHDASIHGSDENVYRQQKAPTLRPH